MRALGNILLECSLLVDLEALPKHSVYLESTLRKLIPKFNRGFILAVYILIRGIEKYYCHLKKIIENDSTFIESQEPLLSIYRKIKFEKDIKLISTSPLLNHSNIKNAG